MKIIPIFLLIFLSFGACSENKQEQDRERYWRKLLQNSAEDSLRQAEIKKQIRAEAEKFSQKKNNPQKLYDAYREFLLLETSDDSLKAKKIKEKLLLKFPESKQTFELANSEFYDKIYPVWRNDSLKVTIISELLKKYPRTNWRRTMYQYLTYSLNKLNRKEELQKFLQEYRTAFPYDYEPFLRSAKYLENSDSTLALKLARQAYNNSFSYPELKFYPSEEWNLEKRAAPIAATAEYSKLLIKFGNYNKAKEILQKTIAEHKPGVDDETTLASCYLQLANCYNELGDKKKAIRFAATTLIVGDTYNLYSPQADSLLRNLANLQNANSEQILKFVRNLTSYNDVAFSDVTTEYGLKDISASRIAWGDFDNDGFQDFLLNGCRLFKNESGLRFVEITATAFPSGIRANGGLWGDFNNDGLLDIVTKEPENVWLNTGNVFKKVTGQNSLKDNHVSTEGIGLGDVNADGFLDIYLANYEKNYVYEKDQFFLGMGKGKFREATEEANLIPKDKINRAGRGVNFGDFDGDGDLDIFVSNYRLTENFLWVNNGKGEFTNQARSLGVSGNETDGWWGHTIGSEWGDFDNDGDLDLITANLAHPRYLDFSDKTMLYENLGSSKQKFGNIRSRAGIKYEETHSEPCWGDLDNDGFLDLYLTSVYAGRRSFLYMNNGDKTFRDITYQAGVRHFNGWGVAFADFDNDGDLDMLVAGGKIQLFRNDTGNIRNWLEIKVISKNHTDGIGSRLVLSNGNLMLTREIEGGKGTTNQNSLIQHFGLGNEKPPFHLEITFPDGNKYKTVINRINRLLVIEENKIKNLN